VAGAGSKRRKVSHACMCVRSARSLPLSASAWRQVGSPSAHARERIGMEGQIPMSTSGVLSPNNEGGAQRLAGTRAHACNHRRPRASCQATARGGCGAHAAHLLWRAGTGLKNVSGPFPQNHTCPHISHPALNLSSVSFSSLLKKEEKGKKKESSGSLQSLKIALPMYATITQHVAVQDDDQRWPAAHLDVR
jgi:hypothetical protein